MTNNSKQPYTGRMCLYVLCMEEDTLWNDKQLSLENGSTSTPYSCKANLCVVNSTMVAKLHYCDGRFPSSYEVN